MIECLGVPLGQVDDVDVVALAGAVAGGVVAAEHFEWWPLPECCLHHDGDEVRRHRPVLADA